MVAKRSEIPLFSGLQVQESSWAYERSIGKVLRRQLLASSSPVRKNPAGINLAAKKDKSLTRLVTSQVFVLYFFYSK
jgi:hypothetical protein